MDMGVAVGEVEASMVDTLAVVIEEGIMARIAEDTMATMVGTMEVTGVEVFIHTGDYGVGDIGDGLFWDGPMLVGPTMAMRDTHI